MNMKVMYHSSTGNTKRIAEAIAETLDIKAEPIGAAALSEAVDLLFLGDGVYFGKPNKETVRFIQQLNPAIVKNVAVFATYGGQANIGEKLKELLQSKQLHVVGEPFICKGKAWGILNRGEPNADCLSEACRYAESITANVNL